MNGQIRIGEYLEQIGLISHAQLEVALQDQSHHVTALKLGEILSLRGWVDQDTIEFFIDDLGHQDRDSSRLRLGEYLILAKLLTQEQVDMLLKEQWQNGVRIGALAVMRGWLKQETLDYLLSELFPEHTNEPALLLNTRPLTNNQLNPSGEESPLNDDLELDSLSEKSNDYDTVIDEDDPWIYG